MKTISPQAAQTVNPAVASVLGCLPCWWQRIRSLSVAVALRAMVRTPLIFCSSAPTAVAESDVLVSGLSSEERWRALSISCSRSASTLSRGCLSLAAGWTEAEPFGSRPDVCGCSIPSAASWAEVWACSCLCWISTREDCQSTSTLNNALWAPPDVTRVCEWHLPIRPPLVGICPSRGLHRVGACLACATLCSRAFHTLSGHNGAA